MFTAIALSLLFPCPVQSSVKALTICEWCPHFHLLDSKFGMGHFHCRDQRCSDLRASGRLPDYGVHRCELSCFLPASGE